MAGPSRLYGWATQQNVLVAYQLLGRESVDPGELAAAFSAMAEEGSEAGAFRRPEPWLRAWLQEAARGSWYPLPFENAGAAVRMVPIGVWFRREAVALVDSAIAAAMLTHSHPGAVVAACAAAGAVAAASFGQAGRDLVQGTAEIAKLAEERVADVPGLAPPKKGSPPLSLLVKHAVPLVGSPIRDVAAEVTSWTPDAASVWEVIAAMVAGAPILERPSVGVREVAALGSLAVATLTGAIVGARVGLHRWPWPIPNELWFAELGRRLASHDARHEDLPDPYAVEEVLASGLRPGHAAG